MELVEVHRLTSLAVPPLYANGGWVAPGSTCSAVGLSASVTAGSGDAIAAEEFVLAPGERSISKPI